MWWFRVVLGWVYGWFRVDSVCSRVKFRVEDLQHQLGS